MKLRSKRLENLQEHYFAGLERHIDRLVSAGQAVYRLDVGSPDLPPAQHILDTLHRSADQPDHHGYQPLGGAKAVRQAWADHYQYHYQVTLDPAHQVLPLIGSKEGIFLITQAMVDPGEVVLVPDPGYMVYAQAARFALADPHPMPLLPENGWMPDFSSIPADILKRSRLMWLNYPNNPTSTLANAEFFRVALDFAHQHDILLCHDAAYSLVTFDGHSPTSLLQFPGAVDSAVEFNTLSKAYNMAGWRIGAAVGNTQVLQSMHKLVTQLNSGFFRPMNDAAIAALTGDQGWIAERNMVYQHRRDRVMNTLHSLGWNAGTPRGALYVWFHTPTAYPSSADFCNQLLDQAGVSLTPGNVFGLQGEGYIRLSFTVPDQILAEALPRLADFGR